VNALDRDRLAELAAEHGGIRISIYMPAHRFGPGSQEADTTRLRNLLRDAETSLAALEIRPSEADAVLAPARALLDDRPFWLRSEEGLALLLASGQMQALRLPGAPEERVWAGERYHLAPLLPFTDAGRRFWVLALSQKRVRLYEGTQAGLTETPAAGIPESLADALQWEDFEKTSLQFHTGTSGSGGRRPAVFHGTGEVDLKGEIVRFFRGIDRGLREHLEGETAPLVVAGVEYLLPLYREVNTYPALTDGSVAGNPDSLGEAALHAQAWAIVKSVFDAERTALATRAAELWGSVRIATETEQVLDAARHGRVQDLLLAEGAHWWGTHDEEMGRVELRTEPGPDAGDLLDAVIADTLRHGGSVAALPRSEMPHGRDAVALLRY
jgi:hypothetical protein